MVALAAGIVVGGLLGFGWWFGLMKHNQWLPILNLPVPIICLAAGPAVLCARLARVRLAIAYAIGSWSFLGWSLVATFLVGGPVVALVTAVGIGLGGLVRVIVRWTKPKT
jgi:hypothetical protein